MSDKPTPRGAAGGADSGDRIPDGRNFLDPSHPDQVHTPAKGREWTDRRIDTRKGMWGATSGPGDTSVTAASFAPSKSLATLSAPMAAGSTRLRIAWRSSSPTFLTA